MSQFAIAIVFPNAGIKDIVTSAVKSDVHIIDKEDYIPAKDYIAYAKHYEAFLDGDKIMLLFVFPEGECILADTEDHLSDATEKIKAIQLSTLN